MDKYEVISDSCKLLWHENFNITSEKYTQVSGYVLNDENQLLIVKNGNNWTIPGGHPEEGEERLETLEREIMEEACLKIKDIKYLGSVEVVENGNRYYQLRYTAVVKEILPFNKEWETSERAFIDLEDLPKYISWSKGKTFTAQIDSVKKLLNLG